MMISQLIQRFLLPTVLALLPTCAAAQSASEASIQRAPTSESISGSTTAATLRDDGSLNATTGTLLQEQRTGHRAQPFGAELFRQVPPTASGSAQDPGYIIRPGDAIQISQTGLVNTNVQATVDPTGNVVVPGVGPVRVAGVLASDVNATIASAARRVFRETVQTYAAPVNATNIQVFVTGPVISPGVYSGSSADSVVGFLQRAGGPDPARGSYRHVTLRRAGRTIAYIDLYRFLVEGDMPVKRIQQGDVIVVGEQGPIITVTGQARAPFTFELSGSEEAGFELLRYARPRPEVTDVSILSIRDGKPINEVLPLQDFATHQLSDGDRIRFEANGRADTIIVQIEGATAGQPSFAVANGTRLGTVLEQIRFDPLADKSMIHLKRTSIAISQKRMLNESLDRLEKVIYTTPSPSADIAQQRQVDAAGLQQFVARARTVQPEGLVSLQGVDPAQIILEPDDVIVVPYISQTVVVSGEVSLPQSLLANGPRDVNYYIARAGGFTERANRKQTLVIRPDSSTTQSGKVYPGDRVLVTPKVSTGIFTLVKDITTILYQAGIAAAAVFK
jgi:protein involved in polysaccharide export with SLBB domain